MNFVHEKCKLHISCTASQRWRKVVQDALNSPVEAGLDLLCGGVGHSELRGDFLQQSLVENNSPIDSLGLF